MLATKTPKSTFQKQHINKCQKKHAPKLGRFYWRNYGVNPRTLFYMGFECLEIKLLKGRGLRFGMKTCLPSHVSWASHAMKWWPLKSGPTNIWTVSTIQIKFKGIQHIDWKIMVHSHSDWRHFCWATASIFHDGRFPEGRKFSHKVDLDTLW